MAEAQGQLPSDPSDPWAPVKWAPGDRFVGGPRKWVSYNLKMDGRFPLEYMGFYHDSYSYHYKYYFYDDDYYYYNCYHIMTITTIKIIIIITITTIIIIIDITTIIIIIRVRLMDYQPPIQNVGCTSKCHIQVAIRKHPLGASGNHQVGALKRPK